MSDDQKQLTQRRSGFLATIQGEGFKKQMALALPKHMTPDRMLRVALTAMNKTPELYDCDPNTVMACMMDCSALGLEPDGRNAYLIPFKDNKSNPPRVVCTLIVGYQGMIELAYRHPQVKGIRAKAVYEKDHFIYDEGLHPRLEHTPYDGEGAPGKLKYAYAICNIGEGGSTFVVLNRREVMEAKAFSRGSGSKYSPWQTKEQAMWVKTAVRALAKFMPRSSELTQAIDIDDRETMIENGAISMASGQVGQTLMEQAAGAGNVGNGGDGGGGQVVDTAGTVVTPADGAPTADSLLADLMSKGAKVDAGPGKIHRALVSLRMIEPSQKLETLDANTLAGFNDAWEQIEEAIRELPKK